MTPDERYFQISTGGGLPTHIALGLLRMGQRRVEDDRFEDDEE